MRVGGSEGDPEGDGRRRLANVWESRLWRLEDKHLREVSSVRQFGRPRPLRIRHEEEEEDRHFHPFFRPRISHPLDIFTDPLYKLQLIENKSPTESYTHQIYFSPIDLLSRRTRPTSFNILTLTVTQSMS